jgi:septal ring factor EnvC (AmiA/AmiB activator)
MKLVYPLRHIHITQKWGVNGDVYARFGFKGHNGVDYRMFDESGNRSTEAVLYAPHSGKVIEARNDPNGYGNYLKIEDDKQGSILAHLKSYSVKVGATVKTGQKIGICDNTGWSTGAHLHWGYYTMPRNRQNGYGGTIDQEKLSIQKLSDWEKTMNQDDGKVFENLVKKSTEYDKTVKYLLPNNDPLHTSFEELQRVIGGIKSRVTDLEKQVSEAKAELLNREEQASRLKDQLTAEQKLHQDVQIKLIESSKNTEKVIASYVGRIEALQGQVDDLAIEKGKLNHELAQCKLGVVEVSIVDKIIEFIKKLWR